jgi:hypothetical protein
MFYTHYLQLSQIIFANSLAYQNRKLIGRKPFPKLKTNQLISDEPILQISYIVSVKNRNFPNCKYCEAITGKQSILFLSFFGK